MKQFLESPSVLETVRAGAETNSTVARELFSELSEDQMNWTSNPEKWSIAQCLDHLTTSTRQFGDYFSVVIERGHKRWPTSSPVAYRPTWIGGWLAKLVSPESARKFPAPKVFRPSQSSITNALNGFLQQQDQFLSFVQKAEGLDYNKTRLRSPVTPLMRYSLADAFVVTVLHGQRHLAQARRMRETPGFPEQS